MYKKTLLITGGAGFIGVNYVYFVLEKYSDYKVVIIDNLTYVGNLKYLDEAFKKYKNRIIFYKENIINLNKILQIFEKEKPNYVIHFAAESFVYNSFINPSLFFETNIKGTNSLLEASKKIGIDRFHYISTDEVYGDLDLNSNIKFNELTNFNPKNPYSASKASAEHLVVSYMYTYGLNITISRSSNNFGPYQYPEKIISKFIMQTLNNKKITVHGSGNNIRDYIYVRDHCDGIDKVLHFGKKGESYNFSSGNEFSNLEIANIIGSGRNIIFVEDRKNNDLKYSMSNDKVIKELGWGIENNFSIDLKNTINWYIENKDFYKNIN